MKNTLILLILILLFAGCVSNYDYDKLKLENNTIKDSLNIYKKELYDIKTGSDFLLEKAKAQLHKNLLYNSKETLIELLSKDSFSKKSIEAEKIMKIIDEKILCLIDSVNWEKCKLENTSQSYKQYLTYFPKGKFNNLATNLYNSKVVESEKEEWENALKLGTSECYKKFIINYPKSNKIKIANKKLIDAEVKEILAGEHGAMPSSNLINKSGGAYAKINIQNNTNYTLTVRYSGIDSKSISIASNTSTILKIQKGFYYIAASVNASNVRNYAGSENLIGGEYSSSYYISNGSSWNRRY